MSQRIESGIENELKRQESENALLKESVRLMKADKAIDYTVHFGKMLNFEFEKSERRN